MNINSILTSFWSSIKAYLGNNYLGKTAKAESAKSADSVAWTNVSDKPSTYTPSSHTHDDRYYTETEIDTKLNSKTNTSDLSTVATSGSYNDLSNKPTIPTKISDLTNDSGFVIDVSGKADKATTLNGYGITDAYTKTQVDKKVSDLVNSAPETLDTLNELAQALGNDPNFATTVATQIGTKANDSDVIHKNIDETITSKKIIQTSTGHFDWSVPHWEMGTIPETDQSNANMWVYDTQNNYMFWTQVWNNSDGTVYHRTGVRNKFKDGVLDPTGTFKDISFDVVIDKNANSYIRWGSGKVNNSILPLTDNTFNLGVSTNRWKDVKTVLLNGKTPAYADDLTNYVTQTEVNTWQTNRLKPSSVVFTVAPSDWQNGVCTKNVGVDSKYHCTLGVPVSTNTTNLINVSSASIIITGHSGNNLTLKCLGNVPTSTITLELTVFYYDVIDKNTDYFNITEQEINNIFGL